jgi:outer membrane lipoprotein-sorting protein
MARVYKDMPTMVSRIRRLVVLIGLALAVPAHPSAQDKPISAEELVKNALNARGGASRIKAVETQRLTGTLYFGPGAEGPMVVELKRPNKLHMEVTIQDQTVVRVYDGRGAGWMVNPFAPDKGPVALTGSDLQNIIDESDFDGPLVDYQAKGNTIESLGKDEVAGKPALKLKLTTKTGEVRTYYFDAATFLLLKWEGIRKSGGQEAPVESFFSDYREVGGLKFPFEVNTDSPGSDFVQKLTVEKIELNPQIDDARFTKPAPPPAASPAGSPGPAKENPERQ